MALPGFKSLGGKSARYITPEGKEISQRQYRKLVREASATTPLINGVKVTSNEALAKLNRQKDLAGQLARPARGRSSLLKAEEKERAKVAAKRAAERLAAEKEMRAEIEAQKIINTRNKAVKRGKVVKKKNFSLNSLRPGRLAFQIHFDSEQDGGDLVSQAKKSGRVLGYAVGMSGVDERSGKRLDAMISGLYDIGFDFEDVGLEERTENFLESKPYFVFTSWFIHFSFTRAYAEYRAQRAGVKMGQRKKRK